LALPAPASTDPKPDSGARICFSLPR